MKRIWLISLVAVCSTTLLCAQDFTEDEKAIIERGAQLQVESYINRVQRECKRRAIDRALLIVDSLMRTDGLNSRIEPVDKPARPQRPGKPPIKKIPDTLKLDSVRRDDGGF